MCALTVIIVPGNPDKSYFLIHNRGKNVAEGKNSYHVVPTGEYQPIQRYDEKGDEIPGLKETIIKEFSEEVLDYGNMGDIYSRKLIENLRDDINAEYYYLGMGLDPLNHKSEILTYMVINLSTSPFFNYWSTISKIKTKIKSNYEGTIEIYPLEDEYIDQFLFNENTIPACRTILSKIKDVGYRNSMNIP